MEVKLNLMCEEDKAHCECIISETNVNIFVHICIVLLLLRLISDGVKNIIYIHT